MIPYLFSEPLNKLLLWGNIVFISCVSPRYFHFPLVNTEFLFHCDSSKIHLHLKRKSVRIRQSFTFYV
jgi:hypothetical protein